MIRYVVTIVGVFVLLIALAITAYFQQHAPAIAVKQNLQRLQEMFRERMTLSVFVRQSIVAIVSAGDSIEVAADQLEFYNEGETAVPLGELGIDWCLMPVQVAARSFKEQKVVPCEYWGTWQKFPLKRIGRRYYIGASTAPWSGALVFRVVDRGCDKLKQNCPRSGKFDFTLKIYRVKSKKSEK